MIRSDGFRALLIATTALVSSSAPLLAQISAKRAEAERIPRAQAPRIDGRLDEKIWTDGARIEDFVQQRPLEGAVPSERTRVYIRYDDEALYVGARMFRERPEEILRAVTRRDGSGNAEKIQVILDTHHDRRTGDGFGVTASGVRSDYHHSSDDEMRGRESQYDPVWAANAVIDSLGWTAEMRIPFSQIRFPNAESQEWGLQINRWIPDKSEDVMWVMIPSREIGYISRFGTLNGIKGVQATRPAEFLPYVAADAKKSANLDAQNPFRDPTKARVGVDAKFGIGSNLTVDATINPDFGQVEADPAEVNLSAFETIVEERRPFFTEGAQLLRTEGPNYFYSRRVGGTPHLSASGDFVDQPRASTILGAAKITGRTRARLSVGALFATTGRSEARVFELDSNFTDRVTVEPQTEYAVVRLQQEIGRQASTIGGTLTAMRREMNGRPTLSAALAGEAYSGGVDWRLRFQQGRYAISGWAGFSHISGDSLAIARVQRSSAHFFQRPDADHLDYDTSRRSLSGITASLRADKDAGEHILWGIQVNTESPGYEVNDLGRLQSSDDVDYNADVQLRETQPGRYLQNWRIGLLTRGALNYGGDRTLHEWSLTNNLSLLNFWSLNINTRVGLPALDDVLTRGGPLMTTPLTTSQEIRVSSPFGGRNSYRLNTGWSRDDLGGHRVSFGGALTVRPAPQWQASIEPSFTRGADARQYVTSVANTAPTGTFGRHYVFAFVDRTTISVRTRLNYAFSPSLTLEGYAEPFVASGHFRDFGELRAPRTNALLTYGNEGTTIVASGGSYRVTGGGDSLSIADPDFNVLSLRSNVVLRWEWNPGSTLFLVWQQNRRAAETLGDPVRLGDLRNTTRARGDNFLSVKVSYWLPVGGR